MTQNKNNLQSDKKLSDFYVNKIMYHHPDYQSIHHLSFREIFYEDPFYKRSNKRPKKTVQSIFMTTKGLDDDLILPLIKNNIKIVIARDKRLSDTKTIIKNYLGYKNCTLIYPPNYDQGCFHAKLWLLKFPNFLRIVIGSGNLRFKHWVNWSNLLWFRDFPLKSNLNYKKNNMSFDDYLNQINQKNDNKFFNSINLEEDFYQVLNDLLIKINAVFYISDINLQDYDIKNIDFILISSVSGKHLNKSLNYYGKMRLRYINQIFLQKNWLIPNELLYMQSSSLGFLSNQIVNEMAFCFMPYQFDENKINKAPYKNCRVIFPSEDYILNEAYEGPQNAQTLFLTDINYSKPQFVRNQFYQYKCLQETQTKKGIIPHYKSIIFINKDHIVNDDTVMYIGRFANIYFYLCIFYLKYYYKSHNFSLQAWGILQKENSQLQICNTELGILLPPLEGSSKKKSEMIQILAYEFPPEKYKSEMLPWMKKLKKTKE